MIDDLIRRQDALNFELTIEGPREAEEAILRTSQGIMDYIKSLPAVSTPTTFMQPIVVDFESIGKAIGEALANDDIVEVVRCKDCKHNPKYEWFICPAVGLNEKQRPETAWCWKGERREDADPPEV